MLTDGYTDTQSDILTQTHTVTHWHRRGLRRRRLKDVWRQEREREREREGERERERESVCVWDIFSHTSSLSLSFCVSHTHTSPHTHTHTHTHTHEHTRTCAQTPHTHQLTLTLSLTRWIWGWGIEICMQDHELDRFLNRFLSTKEPLIIGLICGEARAQHSIKGVHGACGIMIWYYILYLCSRIALLECNSTS